MNALLIELDNVLQVKNKCLYSKLKDPLTEEAIEGLSSVLTYPFPTELKELYKWKNGTNLIEDVSLGSFWLMPLNTFTCLESSLNYYKQLSNSKSANIIPNNYFPIFQSGGGERTFIDIDPESKTFGQLFFFTLSDPDVEVLSTYSDSLSAFLRSIITCYAEGIYYCAKDCILNSIEKRESIIFFKNNPGSNYWSFYSKVNS